MAAPQRGQPATASVRRCCGWWGVVTVAGVWLGLVGCGYGFWVVVRVGGLWLGLVGCG